MVDSKNGTNIVDQTRFDHVRLPPLRIGSLFTCRPGCGVAGGGAPIVKRVPPGGVAAADAPKGEAGCVACPLPKVNVPVAGGARLALVAEAGEDGWLPNVKGVLGVPTGALNVNADDG